MVAPQNTKFATANAVTMLLDVVNPRRAMVDLLKGLLPNFVAPTGDASCMSRCPPVNNASDTARRHLATPGNKDKTSNATVAYEQSIRNMKSDGRIKNVGDIPNKGLGPPEFEQVYEELVSLIGEETWELCTNFYSKTIDCAQSYNPFNMSFARRDKGVYHASTDLAEATEDRFAREDMDNPLKARIGQGTLDYLINTLETMMRHKSSLVQEVVEALESNRATVSTGAGQTYQVGEIFAQFMAIFWLECRADRPMIRSMRRIKLVDDGVEWVDSFIDYFEPLHVSSTDTKEQAAAAMRGAWVYKAEPTTEEGQRAATHLNTWSTFRGSLDQDNEAFKETQRAADLVWQVLQYAANHPSYPGKADMREFTLKRELVERAAEVARHHAYTSTNFPRRDLLTQDVKVSGVDLADLWCCAHQCGTADPLEYFEVTDNNGKPRNDIKCYTDKVIPFAVNHVESDTFENAKEELANVWAKYEAAGKPVLGRFIARYGSGGVHFRTLEEAVRFADMKPRDQKRMIEADPVMKILYSKEKVSTSSR